MCMDEKQALWLWIGLLWQRNRLYRWMDAGSEALYLNDEQAYEFVSLIESGIFRDEWMAEVLGISVALCEAVRRRFPN